MERVARVRVTGKVRFRDLGQNDLLSKPIHRPDKYAGGLRHAFNDQ